MRGLLKLTWLEIRIFMREPLGFVGTVGFPLFLFLLLGRSVSPGAEHSPRATQFLAQDLPLFVSVFISINAALSLIAVIYPMLAISGMFVPLSVMPRPWAVLGNVLPMTHAVSLLRGAWVGAGWLVLLPHLGVLALTIAISLALTSRVFRWE